MKETAESFLGCEVKVSFDVAELRSCGVAELRRCGVAELLSCYVAELRRCDVAELSCDVGERNEIKLTLTLTQP